MLCNFRQTSLLVSLSNAVAQGLIQPFLPSHNEKDSPADKPPSLTEKLRKPGAGGKSNQLTKSKSTTSFALSPEAISQFKEALEVRNNLKIFTSMVCLSWQ